ncbi:hypothetical protein AB0K08_14280 [Citricoccus sp. NPDC055426]|uniref:hypothetical protein n=1 Tax=Citricoccus sp. NPDC055426 TaxID=3155536 RepID=UPI003418342A
MSKDRSRQLAALAGKYIQRQGTDVSEREAQGLISSLLDSWKRQMGDRDGVMSRPDGSQLRHDELRVPKLPVSDRSVHTRQDPPKNVSSAHLADHAIQNYHNLMRGFDEMVVSDDRESLRIHLSAEFVMIRALIEAASLAVWILGPEDSDTRVARAMRFRHTELNFSKKLAIRFADLIGDGAESEANAQVEFVDGQIQDLRLIADRAEITWGKVRPSANPGLIAEEAGSYVPGLGPALTYWYWSTASSIAHGEPENISQLSDVRFVGVDVRDEPVAHMEPSLVTIWNHLQVAHTIIEAAHMLWNKRAASPSRSGEA